MKTIIITLILALFSTESVAQLLDPAFETAATMSIMDKILLGIEYGIAFGLVSKLIPRNHRISIVFVAIIGIITAVSWFAAGFTAGFAIGIITATSFRTHIYPVFAPGSSLVRI